MPDRERLLKAIEFCRANARCDGCPYDGECGTRDNAIEDDTLAMLREQEPVKPKEIRLNFGDGSNPFLFGWECGSCGGRFPFSSYNYCPKCGRAVKWDD